MDPALANAIMLALLRRFIGEGRTLVLSETELLTPGGMHYQLIDGDGDPTPPGSTDWTACRLTLTPPDGRPRH